MVYFDFYSWGTTLRPHKGSLIWALMPKGEMSPTTIWQVECCVKQGSPDQIFTRKTCFMILNKKIMWSLSDTPCWLHTTYPTSLYVRLGRPKKMLRQEIIIIIIIIIFSSKNQRLVLVRLWKGHKGTICWEVQVVHRSIMGISYQILRREASIWAKVGMGQWSWSEVRSRVKKNDSIYMN